MHTIYQTSKNANGFDKVIIKPY